MCRARLACLLVCLVSGCALHPPAACRLSSVTLLGEQHDRAADHAWQLATIARFADANPSLVIGAEMFPRGVQPILDQWTQGQLSEPAFLAQSGWHTYWGFDPALYMPIWRLARDRHMPLLALNVSHKLVHDVAHAGWAAIVPARREGIGTPVPAPPAYRASLAEAMSGHGGPPMTQASLDHFIDAQLVWDRAMAEAIAAERKRTPTRPIVAIMGEGHLQGVSHQLAALGTTAAGCDPPEE